MIDIVAMATQIGAALGVIQQASSLVKDIVPLVKDTETKEKLNEVRESLLTASERINELRTVNNEIVDRNLQLEAEIRQLKEFLSKKETYTLHRLGMGGFVYVAQDAINAPDNAPWYCQHCFDVDHTLSPMNFEKMGEKRTSWFKCMKCGSSLQEYPRN